MFKTMKKCSARTAGVLRFAALFALLPLGACVTTSTGNQGNQPIVMATPAQRQEIANRLLDAWTRNTSGSIKYAPFVITKATISNQQEGTIDYPGYDKYYCIVLQGDGWGTQRNTAVSVSRTVIRKVDGQYKAFPDPATKVFFYDKPRAWDDDCGKAIDQPFPELIGKTLKEKGPWWTW